MSQGTDPGIRIRTKMSRIPNTGAIKNCCGSGTGLGVLQIRVREVRKLRPRPDQEL
jgi:hypothetical protein